MQQIGVLGGTGKAGSALASRLADIGHSVIIGSRSESKAQIAVEEIHARWPEMNLPITFGSNAKAATADLVVVSTPAVAAVHTVSELASALENKVVISMCNSLSRSAKGNFTPDIPEHGSIALGIQNELPKSQIVAAFHHLPANHLADISEPIINDVLVCSDYPEATETVSDIIRSIKRLRPLNAGELLNSFAIESFTATLLNLSKIYKIQASINITDV